MPLVKKLQGKSHDVFQAYHMTESVIESLCLTQMNIEEEFYEWYEQAVEIGQSVDVQPNKPRTARCWNRFCDSAEDNGIEEYFRHSIAVPF